MHDDKQARMIASISPMLAYCVVEFPTTLLALTPTRQYCADAGKLVEQTPLLQESETTVTSATVSPELSSRMAV